MGRKNGRTVASKPFSASTDRPAPTTRVKKKHTEPGNAYTFIPSLPKRHRTSEQTLSLTRDEQKLNRPKRGVEEDSDEDMNARIRKVAMMIAQEDKGDVESDESSIDSDEAWEEDGSDEERWGDVFRDLEQGKKSKKKGKVEERVIKPKKPLTVNLDETDDETEVVSQKSKKKGKVPARKEAAEAEEGDSEGEDQDSEDEDDEDQNEDLPDIGNNDIEIDKADEDDDGREEDEDEDEHGDGPAIAVRGVAREERDGQDDEDDEDDKDDEDDAEGSDVDLPSDLSEDDEDPDMLDGLGAFIEKLAESEKKRKTVEEVKAPKNRRVLPVVSAPAVGDANDLGLKSNQKIDIASLIASAPSLASASSLISKSKPKSANAINPGKLSAPLPTVVQDRINREAAYEKTKEEGAKWATMMKRVKEAEHLQFPLQGSDRGGVKSNGEMLSSFKPMNGHESAIQSLLVKANLTESEVTAAEDEALQGKDLSIEEIAERRAVLRQQRELMFREEARQKRVAKIKSKTFRKLARKRAAKAGEAALEGMDEEDALDLQEKMERERAKERATLKHGAKTGRWARDTQHMHGMSEEYRSARGDMLDMKEKLKRRIEGKGDVSDEEPSVSEGDEENETAIRRRAFDQLDKLDQDHQDVGEKGLLGMKFMKNAEERRRQAAREEEVEMRRDIEMFGEDEESEEEDGEKAEVLKLSSGGGRMVFSGPAPSSMNAGSSSVVANGSTPAAQNGNSTSTLTIRRPRSPPPLPSTEENPWLTASASAGPSRKRNTILTANSSSVDKSSAALQKAKSSTFAKVDDDAVEIEVDGDKLLQRKKRKDVGSEDEDEQETLLPRQRVGFKQRDLVAEAFAGDNVVQDFAVEKQRVIEEDAPKVEDTSLPGWGSWSGKGTKKRKTNPKFLKTTPGLLATDRKDARFSNVIISEKKDKKASQFQVKDLPYPYTSVEQYEARFKNPLGAEWNSRGVHQRETMPRVTKKKGAIIEPVRRLF